MADLKTTYLGLELRNPLIVGASNLVMDLELVKKIEEAGAGAIVYKSLFEEQIQLESLQMHEDMQEYAERHAEMISLFPSIEHAGPAEHIANLKKLKETVSIPVIASLNCIYTESWEEYAQMLEKAGADALELNFYAVPDKNTTEGKSIEDQQLEFLKTVKAAVKIPVSVKMSYFYSNILNVVHHFDEAGADGVVLFNRLFQPDIDIKEQHHYSPLHLSNSEEDFKLPLRYAGLLSGTIKGSICSNTGFYHADQIVKALLAGADAVQVVSTIYKNNVSHLFTILNELNSWMEVNHYAKISDFKGKLSRKNLNDPMVYRRAQYVDILLKSEEIFKRYPLR